VVKRARMTQREPVLPGEPNARARLLENSDILSGGPGIAVSMRISLGNTVSPHRAFAKHR